MTQIKKYKTLNIYIYKFIKFNLDEVHIECFMAWETNDSTTTTLSNVRKDKSNTIQFLFS